MTSKEFKNFLKTKDNFLYKHTFKIDENNQTFINKRFRLYILPFWFICVIIISPFIALFTDYTLFECYKEGIINQFNGYTTSYIYIKDTNEVLENEKKNNDAQKL